MSFADLKTADHRKLNPFGQIPTWQDGDLALFESGAIVLHIAMRYSGLLPDRDPGRSRAIAWTFAALDTVEPPIWDWDLARMVEADKPWHAEREPMLEARIHQRLSELGAWLGGSEWLDGNFSLGDLMMITVLRRLQGSELLKDHPLIEAYIDRGEARPAFARAFAAQKTVYDVMLERTQKPT